MFDVRPRRVDPSATARGSIWLARFFNVSNRILPIERYVTRHDPSICECNDQPPVFSSVTLKRIVNCNNHFITFKVDYLNTGDPFFL